MTSFIETVLQKLLTPDSAVIKQATKQLLEYFVSDKCVTGLFDVLKNSQTPQNRVYAATLLRKKVKNWKTLQASEKDMIKGETIEVLVKETDEACRKQIMWFIASTYKYCIKSGQEWPELLLFINNLIVSEAPEQHLSGVYMLSILNEESAKQMKPHYVNILGIFSKILSSLTNLKSAYYTLSSLKSMIPYTNEVELNELTALLPLAVNATVNIIKADQEEETITTIFDFFQSLIEYDIPMISPYIKSLTEMVLQLISDPMFKNPTRVCAMNFLNVLIETQKANLIKNDMIRPIVNSVFMIMSNSSDPLEIKSDVEVDLLDEDNTDDEKIVDDTENLFTSATQVLDYCALYFPAKKFLNILIEYVQPAITSDNPLHRRAALSALAITSQGCADYYRNHYLELLTDLCLKGMQDSNNQVVQISYFALCQFSEYLQPNLTQFANRIMQLLIETIEVKVELRSISRLTIRFYDALQSFCENLGEDLEPYLPTLMSKLMTLEVQCNSSLKVQRLIISTFSSIVCSVKTSFNPYFDFVVQIVKPHVSYSQILTKNNESKLLQIECIDLMGVFAKFISKDKFTDVLIENCVEFVQTALTNETDVEIRSAAYDLLAGLSSKLKENVRLNVIMPQIIESLKSEEGINIIDSEDKKNDLFSAFDEIDLQEEEDDDEDEDEELEDEEADINGNYGDESQKVVIENEYVAEKLSAIYCLQEITKYQNPQIFDYYNECFEELKHLAFFIHHNIRKESFLAMAYLISYYHDYCISNLHKVADEAQRENIIRTFNNGLKEFHQNTVKTIKSDADRPLIMSVFDAIRTLFMRCAPYIKNNLNNFAKPLETYGTIILDTFQNKILCQIVNKDEDGTDFDENQAEHDYMIKEYAGDIVPAIALCLTENLFDEFFDKILVYLIKILNKSDSSIAEKSFVVGVIGETVANLEQIKPNRAQQLFKEVYKHIYSTEDEIRSNTIYTIGVLCSNSNNALQQYYQQIINDLNDAVKIEKYKQAFDNICGTLCRLYACCVSAGIQTVNYEMIITAIFDLTPLKVDYNEYHTLFTFILQNIANKSLTTYYQKLVEIAGKILLNEQEEFKKGTRELVIEFIKYINDNYKQEMDILLSQIKPEISMAIQSVL